MISESYQNIILIYEVSNMLWLEFIVKICWSWHESWPNIEVPLRQPNFVAMYLCRLNSIGRVTFTNIYIYIPFIFLNSIVVVLLHNWSWLSSSQDTKKVYISGACFVDVAFLCNWVRTLQFYNNITCRFGLGMNWTSAKILGLIIALN